MEIYDSNPKSWASRKQSQKYCDPQLKRKTHRNGASLRKIAVESYFVKNSKEFTFKKSIRNPTINDGMGKMHSDIYGSTLFEENLNINMLTNLNYSLNKHKNWERIPNIIKSSKPDEQLSTLKHKDKRNNECNEIKLAYFDMNELEEKTNKLILKQQKYDKLLNYNINDINNYIKDNFYISMKNKLDKKYTKKWRDIQRIRPKNISKISNLLKIKSITARTSKHGCKVRQANIHSFSMKSYWSPIKMDDSRDYIQIDLGENKYIEAISTRGRCLKRNSNYDIDYMKSFIEYVKKYKIMIKKDDGKSVIKYNYSKKRKRKQKHIVNHSSEEFISLGVFNGNTDSETEVANKLKLVNDNKNGVFCRYIRIYPLSHSQGGYCGKKAMRVGVYGNNKSPKNGKKHRNSKNDDVNVNTDENSLDNNNNDNGGLIQQSNVPAAIITISKPSDTNNRNCWAPKHMNPGVFSCSCYMCSDKRRWKVARQDMRNSFKKQVKKLKHVNDYSVYNSDWIGLHPTKSSW